MDHSSKATTADGVWQAARTSADLGALIQSDCLDSAAKAYAEAAAALGESGEIPATPDSDCGGGVTFGYVLGFDETGVSQATAAMTATRGEASPLAAEGEQKMGWAVVPSQGITGEVNGYVLGWAVSR